MKSIFNEPSTWAGLAIVVTGIGNVIAKDYALGIGQIVGGLIAVFKREAANNGQ